MLPKSLLTTPGLTSRHILQQNKHFQNELVTDKKKGQERKAGTERRMMFN